MFKVQFEAGATVLEQGAVPKSTDCLYFLDQGEVDIVIAGSGEAANVAGEERKVGHLIEMQGIFYVLIFCTLLCYGAV